MGHSPDAAPTPTHSHKRKRLTTSYAPSCIHGQGNAQRLVTSCTRAGGGTGTYLLSKCWLTVSSLVPSSGLMSFQGVGLSLVQTTAHPPHRQASCPSEALGKTYQQDRAQDATSTTYHPLRRRQQ